MLVFKFGGKSLSSLEKIENIAKQIKDFDDWVTIVSAIGDTTDRIVNAIRKLDDGKKTNPEEIFENYEAICPNEFKNVMDDAYYSFNSFMDNYIAAPKKDKFAALLHSYGERLSAYVISKIFNECGIDSEPIDFFDDRFPLIVEGYHLNAIINLGESRKRAKKLTAKRIVFPGYGGIDKNGDIKLLGRGGSDTACFGHGYAFKADEIWVCSDVYGIKTTDFGDAETIKELDIKEAMDMGFFGAKLPNARSLEPLKLMYAEGLNPKVYMANSEDMSGRKTEIKKDSEEKQVKLIAGRDINLYSIEGNCTNLIDSLTEKGIDWYSPSSSYRYLRLVVSKNDEDLASTIINEFEKSGKIHVSDRCRDVSIVGMIASGMKYQIGVAERFNSALTRNGINILYTCDPSDVSIGVIIGKEDKDRAINALYNEFFLRNNDKN